MGSALVFIILSFLTPPSKNEGNVDSRLVDKSQSQSLDSKSKSEALKQTQINFH